MGTAEHLGTMEEWGSPHELHMKSGLNGSSIFEDSTRFCKRIQMLR